MKLVDSIQSGDEVAFARVYHSFNEALYGFIFSKTGSDFYATEVVQMTFVRLWINRSSLKQDIPLDTQIYQIAKTTLIDVFRKVEKERTKAERLSIFAVEQENDSFAEIEAFDINFLLNNAMAKMPPVRKKVFGLRVNGGLSYKEISAALSISVKTVNKHMELARMQISPILRSLLSILLIFSGK